MGFAGARRRSGRERSSNYDKRRAQRVVRMARLGGRERLIVICPRMLPCIGKAGWAFSPHDAPAR